MATTGEPPTTSLSEAKAALGRKEYALAIDRATEAIAAAPKEAPAYVIRAEALRRLKRFDRALADLAVAMRLQPDRPSAYVVRAEILKKRCQFDQAIADATQALFRDPDNAAAYSIRASCRQSIGDIEGASADHEELARLDPTRSTNHPAVPARISSPQAAVSSTEAPWDDERHLFADGKPVDRSYRSRPMIRTEDAAEVLGTDSGYRPGVLPRSAPRSRPKAPARGMGYGLGLVGLGVVVGCLLMMRGGGTPATSQEPQPRSVSPTIPTAKADDGRSALKVAAGADKTTVPKDVATVTAPPDGASEPVPETLAVRSFDPPTSPAGPPDLKTVVKDLGSFSLTKGGRSWAVVMPERFTKAEVAFYRGTTGDRTLNAAWAGHLQINGRDVVRFKGSSGSNVFRFHDYTTGTDYEEVNDYGRREPERLLDVTNLLHPGENSFYYYHEQRPDLPMGLVLSITGGVGATAPPQGASEPVAEGAASPSPTPVDDRPKALRVRQVRLSLAEDGDCRLVIDTRAGEQPQEEPTGEAATLAGISNAVVRKTQAGSHRIVYNFAEVASTADFARLNGAMPQPLDGISIDRTAGTLVLTPVPIEKSQGKRARFSFPRLVDVPLSIGVDFEELPGGTFFVELNSQQPAGVLGVNVAWDRSHQNVVAHVFWVPVVGGRQGKAIHLLDRKLEAEKLSDFSLHLPIDPTPIRDRFSLSFGHYGQEPVSIRRLDVEARVIPSFGIEWDTDRGKLRVKSVTKGGPSERAGLKVGDLLVSVGGQKPTSLKDLMARLALAPIGEELKFVVQRGGQEKTIAVKGE